MNQLVKTEVVFKVGRVQKILEHALSCDEQIQLGGAGEGPGLVLVGSSTIFLASNGKDDVADEARLAWAEGLNPSKWEDDFDLFKRKTELMGCEEAAIYMPAASVRKAIEGAQPWDAMKMKIAHDGRRARCVESIEVWSSPFA